uniref:Uncharacterized protein n=1 Tax=Rhizophora mucronata TaxID=61149 RepID=A0A2P2PQ30_RHIMU
MVGHPRSHCTMVLAFCAFAKHQNLIVLLILFLSCQPILSLHQKSSNYIA